MKKIEQHKSSINAARFDAELATEEPEKWQNIGSKKKERRKYKEI